MPCNIGKMADRLMRDKIVFTVTDKLRQVLLRENTLSLTRAIQLCRLFDTSQAQAKLMQDPNENTVHKVSVHGKPPSRTIKYERHSRSTKYPMIDCQFCGRNHKMGKSYCPAFGKTCGKCGGRYHFRVKCKTRVNLVQNEENSTSSTEEYLHTVSKSEQERERLTAMLSINNCDIRFQIDTGADISTICTRFVRKEQVRPCSRTLPVWNKSIVLIAGETTLDVFNSKTNEVFSIQFLVVHNNFHCLLGLEAVKSLNLVTVNCNTFIASVRNESLGELESASSSVDVSTKPRVFITLS